jgi:hypothetical protein
MRGKKFEDLTLKKFGKLLVIEQDTQYLGNNARWKCQCECGGIRFVLGFRLKNADVQSCGCDKSEKVYAFTSAPSPKVKIPKPKSETIKPAGKNTLDRNWLLPTFLNKTDPTHEDMIGRRIGSLVVLSNVSDELTSLETQKFNCLCDCGKQIIAYKSNLLYRQKSCGCGAVIGYTGSRINFANQRFGKLTVISYVTKVKYGQSGWLCKCDCGKDLVVLTQRLLRNKIRSCGCEGRYGTLDLTGKKFGQVEVIERLKTTKTGNTRWLCQCACGKKIIRRGCQLKNVKSCGCLHEKTITFWKEKSVRVCGDIPYSYLTSVQSRSKKTGYIFHVTPEYVNELFQKQNKRCALSGLLLTFAKGIHSTDKTTASLDRIDNEKGYEVGNVQWLHKDINRMKSCFYEKQFIDYCRLVAKHLPSVNLSQPTMVEDSSSENMPTGPLASINQTPNMV